MEGSPDPRTDGKLLAATVTDPEAFAVFYRRHEQTLLGWLMRQTGDPEGAMQAYQDALTYREFYPEAYNNLGTLLQEDKRFEEAEHALKKAIVQAPAYIEAIRRHRPRDAAISGSQPGAPSS